MSAQTSERDRPVPWRVWLPLATLLPLGALAAVLASQWSPFTERWYARGLFPWVARALSSVARLAPFSLAELGLALLATLLVLRVSRAALALARRRRSVRNVLAHAAGQVLGGSGVVYVAFLGLWGFNYARLPIGETLGLEPRPGSADEWIDLLEEIVEEVNAARSAVGEGADGLARLHGDRSEVLARLPIVWERAAERYALFEGPAPAARLALTSRVLSAYRIPGIYSPFTGEPHVSAHQPELSVPFVACHETAHARGFAREDEANFVGFLVCRESGEADFAYSGWLTALRYVVGPAFSEDPQRARVLQERIAPAVLADLEASRRFWQRQPTPAFSGAVRVTQNTYLRAQGVKDGVRSYGRVCDWLLAEFRGGGGGGRAP